MMKRKSYLIDVSDEERTFAASFLTSVDEKAFWRTLLTNFPSCEIGQQQTRRWLCAACFEAMVSDQRSVIRAAQQRQGLPSAAIPGERKLQFTCESGPRAATTAISANGAAKFIHPLTRSACHH
jgi:hypothetical protein